MPVATAGAEHLRVRCRARVVDFSDRLAMTPRSTFLFSPLMADGQKKVSSMVCAQRDPSCLDRLIEEYQHRLFGIWRTSTRACARERKFFQRTWIRCSRAGISTTRFKFEAWTIYDRAQYGDRDFWQRQKKKRQPRFLIDREEEGKIDRVE